MVLSQVDQFAGEVEQREAVGIEVPVVPRRFVVLAIGVVVAVLRAADFVAAADHRHALREQQRRQQIALLPLAELDDFGIVSRAFDAHVPGVIVVGAVAIVFAVRLVVLLVVADQIVERESVVRGDEIDAGGRAAAVPLVQIAASRSSRYARSDSWPSSLFQ